jgi:hypothetical protein
MDLTLREGDWKEFCMKLIAVISQDNFYSQFYRPSVLLVIWYYNRLLTLIRQFLLIPNRSNELIDFKP